METTEIKIINSFLAFGSFEQSYQKKKKDYKRKKCKSTDR